MQASVAEDRIRKWGGQIGSKDNNTETVTFRLEMWREYAQIEERRKKVINKGMNAKCI